MDTTKTLLVYVDEVLGYPLTLLKVGIKFSRFLLTCCRHINKSASHPLYKKCFTSSQIDKMHFLLGNCHSV
jgi:hypothetical protein